MIARESSWFLRTVEDEETWPHHLRAGDYELWFRDIIKDKELAQRAATLGNNGKISAHKSRKQIFEYIRQAYEKEP